MLLKDFIGGSYTYGYDVWQDPKKIQVNYAIINHKGHKMYTMTGIIQGNTVLTNDKSLEKYNGRKVIITVLEDEKQFESVPDERLFAMSDSLMNQNMEAYQELAK